MGFFEEHVIRENKWKHLTVKFGIMFEKKYFERGHKILEEKMSSDSLSIIVAGTVGLYKTWL